jgi:hypothetical protein
MTTTITTAEVQKAQVELDKMRRSLTSWLKYRSINDQVLAGTLQTRKPTAYAQQVVVGARSPAIEQDLANKLSALLSVVMQGQTLPEADLSLNPQGAVQLAQLAIYGSTAAVSGPTATGGMFAGGTPWLSWPVLIVGGLLLVITTAIGTAADVAKDREEKACIEAGACTDYGFWLKVGGLTFLAWFFWREAGGKELVHSWTKKGRA